MKLKVFFKRYILVTFIICIAVFMILSITGYYVCGKNIDIANNLIGAFMDMADDSGLIKDDGQISVVALFLNNLRATGMAVVFPACNSAFIKRSDNGFGLCGYRAAQRQPAGIFYRRHTASRDF